MLSFYMLQGQKDRREDTVNLSLIIVCGGSPEKGDSWGLRANQRLSNQNFAVLISLLTDKEREKSKARQP